MSDLLYHDDFAGITHQFVPLDDKKFAVRTTGDVNVVLDANKHDANHAPNWSADRSLKHVARIPVEVYLDWLHTKGVDALNPDHKEAVRALLNDKDWQHLRTGAGAL